jgi:hypothetical protein
MTNLRCTQLNSIPNIRATSKLGTKDLSHGTPEVASEFYSSIDHRCEYMYLHVMMGNVVFYPLERGETGVHSTSSKPGL